MGVNTKLLAVAAVSALAGMIGGGFLHAQTAAAPAYLIADLKITNPDIFKQYLAGLPATLAPYKVRTVARGAPVALDSATPPRDSLVILMFNSVDDIKAWWNSPAYQAIIPLREKSSETRAYAVQGVPPS